MSDQEKARAQQELADAQAKLEDLKKDADIAERKLKLDSDMYYGKPEYSNDTAGKAALDSETADVNNKKAAVAAKEKEIQDLSKKLGAPCHAHHCARQESTGQQQFHQQQHDASLQYHEPRHERDFTQQPLALRQSTPHSPEHSRLYSHNSQLFHRPTTNCRDFLLTH